MTLVEKQARANAVRQLLINTDYQAIKASEGMISEAEYAETKAQRQAWRDEINALEAEIAQEELGEASLL
ncbi:MAG: hypothetical protein ACRDBM_10350 [Sporomusa sp.]